MTTGMRRLAALARGLGWGRNPLRRRSDRIEAAVVVAAVLLALAALPAALAVGTRVHRHYLAVSATQAAAERHVTATLLEPAGTIPMGSADSTVAVRARWFQPPGVRHVGTVRAAESTPAGTRVRIWTDPAGNLVNPPLSADQAWSRGVFAGFAATLVAVGLLATLVAIVRLRLDRVRYAAWTDEWRRMGWTQHRKSP